MVPDVFWDEFGVRQTPKVMSHLPTALLSASGGLARPESRGSLQISFNGHPPSIAAFALCKEYIPSGRTQWPHTPCSRTNTTLSLSLNLQHFKQSKTKEIMMEATRSASPETLSLGVIFQLIECREWEGVISFFNKVPEAASIGRVYGEDVMNLPLHEVLQQQSPPLTVLNLLLDLNPGGIKQKGNQGNLPLHYACLNKSVSNKIITRLLEAYPTAVRCRNDEDALPIHLACQNLEDEESVLTILQSHPEGYYLRDADDFTPADYISSSNGIKQSIEKIAPILVQTAKAASLRKTEEQMTREKGIQEAHAEYIRQMGEMEEQNQNELIQAQIDLQNELAEEKERNIALAEFIIEKERKEQDMVGRLNQTNNMLQQERKSRQEENELQEHEYRSILGMRDEDSNTNISSKLSSLIHRYNSQEMQFQEMSKDLTYNANMVRNLNELLTSKDEQIQDLNRHSAVLQQQNQEAIQRSNTLEESLNKSDQDLLEARREIQRLGTMYEGQQDQLTEANRIVRVQDSRLASIKSLAQSLNFNIESWALDDEQEEGGWEQQQQQQTHQQQKDAGKFQVLEGMETIRHGSRGRQRISPKATEDYSLKTNDTSMSTRPSEDDATSLRLTMASPARPKTLPSNATTTMATSTPSGQSD